MASTRAEVSLDERAARDKILDPQGEALSPVSNLNETLAPMSSAAMSSESTATANPLVHWMREGQWPPQYFKKTTKAEPLSILDGAFATDVNRVPLGGTRTAPGTAPAFVPNDQGPRDEKKAPYCNPGYAGLLAANGIFMGESESGITEASKSTVKMLLENPQECPKSSLFDEDRFEETCRLVANGDDKSIIRDVMPLIVPPAERRSTGSMGDYKFLTETFDEPWIHTLPLTTGIGIQPDYAVGFSREVFTDEQLVKLKPLVCEFTTPEVAAFMSTRNMWFPFLVSEVDHSALYVADHQNAHSATVAVRALVELLRIVKREKEVDGQIMAFSVSHDGQHVGIYGHYANIQDDQITYHRHVIRRFNVADQSGAEKWTAYQFTRNVHDFWLPAQCKLICSAIDQLPSDLDQWTSLISDLSSEHPERLDTLEAEADSGSMMDVDGRQEPARGAE